MAQVTGRNAFPMQKNYNELDYQALGAAILYLTRHERANPILLTMLGEMLRKSEEHFGISLLKYRKRLFP